MKRANQGVNKYCLGLPKLCGILPGIAWGGSTGVPLYTELRLTL